MKIIANENFKEIRLRSGYTMQSLADAIGVSRQMIRQFEARLNGIGPDKAKKISDIFKRDFDELFELVKREGA